MCSRCKSQPLRIPTFPAGTLRFRICSSGERVSVCSLLKEEEYTGKHKRRRNQEDRPGKIKALCNIPFHTQLIIHHLSQNIDLIE